MNVERCKELRREMEEAKKVLVVRLTQLIQTWEQEYAPMEVGGISVHRADVSTYGGVPASAIRGDQRGRYDSGPNNQRLLKG